MRRLLVALAVAVLAASGPAAAAQAAGVGEAEAYLVVPVGDASGALLTPDQLGLTNPGQGFYPYFLSPGQGSNGILNGGGLNGFGLGGVAPGGLTAANLFSGFGGCGIFSIAFCPFFSAAPFTSTFLSQNGGRLGLGGALGTGGLSPFGLGGLFTPGFFGPGGTFILH